jgi:hypothetical protein
MIYGECAVISMSIRGIVLMNARRRAFNSTRFIIKAIFTSDVPGLACHQAVINEMGGDLLLGGSRDPS